ncbi:MAG: transposase [Treponema sp.]|nr:transposase [Treponema sp.]
MNELHAIHVVNINLHYTSQQCNRCGTIDKSSRNKSRYICVHCGHTDHADVHAAKKNIRDKYAGLSNRDRLARQLEKRKPSFSRVARYNPLGLSQG